MSSPSDQRAQKADGGYVYVHSYKDDNGEIVVEVLEEEE